MREVPADGKSAVSADLAVDREISADCDSEIITLRGDRNRNQTDGDQGKQERYSCVAVHTTMLDAGKVIYV